MPTIALRVPTVLPGTDHLPGGQCYILFDQPCLTVRDLIAAKVSAELRKARAGGLITTSLPLLLPQGVKFGFSPLDEQLAIAQACHAFADGQFLLLRNGVPLVDLDEQVQLDRRTKLVFVHAAVTSAKEPVQTQDQAAA